MDPWPKEWYLVVKIINQAVGLTRYFENVRYILVLYEAIFINPYQTYTGFVALANTYGVYNNLTSNANYNYIISLNNFNQSTEARTIQ